MRSGSVGYRMWPVEIRELVDRIDGSGIRSRRILLDEAAQATGAVFQCYSRIMIPSLSKCMRNSSDLSQHSFSFLPSPCGGRAQYVMPVRS